MMAKIVKGSGARGIVDYILDSKKQATLIDYQGVLLNDNASIARGFIAQSRLNPHVDHRLKEPDKSRYEIYQVLKREVARCSDWNTLLKRLKAEGIDVRFKYKGNTNEIQGIVFTKNGYHFNGSKIDRCFSYSKIDRALKANAQGESQRQYEPQHTQTSHIDNRESELISGSLGLLDFTSSPDADNQEEAEFRRLMQQKKKKKKTRGFKL